MRNKNGETLKMFRRNYCSHCLFVFLSVFCKQTLKGFYGLLICFILLL